MFFESDEAAEISNFIIEEAIEVDKEEEQQYCLLQKFMEWKNKTEIGDNGAVDDLNGNSPQEIITPFMDVAFATGFLYGAMFAIADPEVNGILDEIKKALIEKGILSFYPRTENGPARMAYGGNGVGRKSKSALATS